VLTILFIIQGILQKNKPPEKKRLVHIVAIVLALLGLIFTYYDFSNTVTHRMLGTSFHVGAYLFWAGWIAISIYYLVPGRRDIAVSTKA
jgi:threonine/homoserine efflux transporter RhtA